MSQQLPLIILNTSQHLTISLPNGQVDIEWTETTPDKEHPVTEITIKASTGFHARTATILAHGNEVEETRVLIERIVTFRDWLNS